jgi:hypothetical protein
VDGTRHQLLAGTALSRDQERPRDRRDALDLLEQPAQLLRSADDAGALLEALVEAGVLLVEPARAD